MRILFVGDIVGRPGRDLVRHGLAALVEHHHIDLVIVNAENAAAGFGITREIGAQLLELGVDLITSGNHIWNKKEALDYIGAEPRLLRPINYPAGVPGNGSYLARTKDGVSVGVINAMGRVFMLNIDDSFIGVEIEHALGTFLNALPARFETATANPRLNAVVIEADEQTGHATDIERLSYSADEIADLGRLVADASGVAA